MELSNTLPEKIKSSKHYTMYDNTLIYFIKSKKTFKTYKSDKYGVIIFINETINFVQSGQKGLFLYNMVAKDAETMQFTIEHKFAHGAFPTNGVNSSFEYSSNGLSCIDFNAYYWNVALDMGLITIATYDKGLSEKGYKKARLSALSSLSNAKEFTIYEKGEIVGKEYEEMDTRFYDIYSELRYIAMKLVCGIATMLNNDYLCHKTDAIYFNSNRSKEVLAFIRMNTQCTIKFIRIYNVSATADAVSFFEEGEQKTITL